MSANGYKIKVNGEAESREAQLGYFWNIGLAVEHLAVKNLASNFLYAKNGMLTVGCSTNNFENSASKEITLEELRNLVNGNENGLISGADALRALADGKEVEYEFVVDRAWNVVSSMSVNLILNDNFRFRLKPRTINLNGIEISSNIKASLDSNSIIFDSQEDFFKVIEMLKGLKNATNA